MAFAASNRPDLRRASGARTIHGFPPPRKWRCFGGCFAAARTSTRSAGRARPPASLATHRPAPTSGAAGVCEKPRIKCGDCGNRLLIPLTDSVIYDHLAGKRTIGVYPLLEDDTCHFLAVDFDEAEWREDATCLRPVLSTSWVSQSRSRSRAPATARMPGFSSLAAYRPAMPADWAPPSSATPAPAPGN